MTSRFAVSCPTFVPFALQGAAASEQHISWRPKYPCVVHHVRWRSFSETGKRALAQAELVQLTAQNVCYIDSSARSHDVGITSPFHLDTLAPSVHPAELLELRFWFPVESETRIVLGVSYLRPAAKADLRQDG